MNSAVIAILPANQRHRTSLQIHTEDDNILQDMSPGDKKTLVVENVCCVAACTMVSALVPSVLAPTCLEVETMTLFFPGVLVKTVVTNLLEQIVELRAAWSTQFSLAFLAIVALASTTSSLAGSLPRSVVQSKGSHGTLTRAFCCVWRA